MNNLKLQCGCYYRINGTNKILYFDGDMWYKPVKNNQGKYSTHVQTLEKQPNVKNAEMVQESDLY